MINIKTREQKLKATGFAILLLPIGFLLLFAFGEILGGDLSGAGHFIQLAPLLLVIWISWKAPKVGGLILIAIGLILAIVYPIMARGFSIPAIVSVEVLLFGPPIIAGTLFYLSSKK
jgi:hypothetical protein